MQTYTKTKNKSSIFGFTLIEISVVLVIIALITTSFIGAGEYLIRTLQLKKIIDNAGNYVQATEQFKNTYGGLPGDLWDAQTKFGSSNTTNGDGNDQIDTGTEQVLAFQHLALTGLITGTYIGSWTVGSTKFAPSGPGSDGELAKYYFGTVGDSAVIYYAGVYDANEDNSISTSGGSTEINRGTLTPSDMAELDSRYDDGLPSTGFIIGLDGSNVAAGSCVSSGSYVATNNSAKSCYFYIYVAKYFR